MAISSWWTEPIFYQKLVLWTVLLECLGVAGSWGPMAGHFKPFTCGWRYYLRVDTIRQPPWSRVPFTRGDRRTGIRRRSCTSRSLATLVTALVLPGVADADLYATGFDAGRVAPVVGGTLAVLMIALGLRDKSSSCRPAGSSTYPPSSSSPPSPPRT